MNDSKQKEMSVSGQIVSGVVSIVVLGGIYYFGTNYDLPIRLIVAIVLFSLTLFLTITNFKSFDTPRRVCCVGLSISTLILSGLFAYKYYVADIRITALHIGVIIMLPFIIWRILEKRSKEDEV